MHCPRDRSELSAKIYESQEIDQCPACSGVFLDQGELEAIQANVEKHPTPEAVRSLVVARAPVEPVDTSAVIACPRCEKTMARRRYGFGSDVMIDECPDGCGVWLDGGELQQLETFYEKSQEENPLPITWRLWAAVRGAISG